MSHFCPRDGHQFIPGPFDKDGVGSSCAVCGAVRPMPGDDIGSYYDRKYRERAAALNALGAHVQTCATCKEALVVARKSACKEQKKLRATYERAAYVGD